MDVEQLREYCLTKTGAEEGFPFGPENLVIKVGGKMFILVSLDAQPLRFNVKCDPEKAIELRESYSAVLPGYHMNKKYWNTIVVDGSISTQQLKEFVVDSYLLVVNKKK
jgi:predicted DNA-binding protein (MmcQ/YjbR family)